MNFLALDIFMGFCMVRSVFVGYFCIYFFLSLYFWVIPHGLLFLQLLLRSKFHDGTEGRCLEAIVHVQPLVLEGSHPLPPGLSNSWPVALRVAPDGAQHKTVNLLKTFFCSSVFVSVCVFNVWSKTILLSVWTREAKRLDTPATAMSKARPTSRTSYGVTIL